MAETPEVIATIAGTGELEGQLRELADELGCASRVNFAGWSDPVSVLSTVDAVVLPSRDEGLPLVMLEAMRAGFPVIATSVGSVTEALEDGVTGLVIPPEDHVALVRSLRRFAASPEPPQAAGNSRKGSRRSVLGRSDGWRLSAGLCCGAHPAAPPEPAVESMTRPRFWSRFPRRASQPTRESGCAPQRPSEPSPDSRIWTSSSCSADQPLDARPVPADVSVHHWSIVRKKRRSLPAAALRMMLQLLPLQTAVLDWAEMRAEIVRLGPESFSLVWFGALDHFVVLRDLVPDIPAVVDYDDIEPAKIAAFLAVAPRDVPGQVMRAKARVERVFWRRLERLAKRHCAAVIVCSDHDVHRLGGGRTVAVPNTYPDPGVTAQPSPRRRTGIPLDSQLRLQAEHRCCPLRSP